MNFKSNFVSCLILALVQFESVQPNVWTSLASRINRFAYSMVNRIVHPYTEMLEIIQSQTTKALCGRNTVAKDIKTSYDSFI